MKQFPYLLWSQRNSEIPMINVNENNSKHIHSLSTYKNWPDSVLFIWILVNGYLIMLKWHIVWGNTTIKRSRFLQLVLSLSYRVYLQMSEMKVFWGEGSNQGQQMQHKTTLFCFHSKLF